MEKWLPVQNMRQIENQMDMINKCIFYKCKIDTEFQILWKSSSKRDEILNVGNLKKSFCKTINAIAMSKLHVP